MARARARFARRVRASRRRRDRDRAAARARLPGGRGVVRTGRGAAAPARGDGALARRCAAPLAAPAARGVASPRRVLPRRHADGDRRVSPPLSAAALLPGRHRALRGQGRSSTPTGTSRATPRACPSPPSRSIPTATTRARAGRGTSSCAIAARDPAGGSGSPTCRARRRRADLGRQLVPAPARAPRRSRADGISRRRGPARGVDRGRSLHRARRRARPRVAADARARGGAAVHAARRRLRLRAEPREGAARRDARGSMGCTCRAIARPAARSDRPARSLPRARRPNTWRAASRDCRSARTPTSGACSATQAR